MTAELYDLDARRNALVSAEEARGLKAVVTKLRSQARSEFTDLEELDYRITLLDGGGPLGDVRRQLGSLVAGMKARAEKMMGEDIA